MQDMTNVTDIDILCLIFSKDKDLPIFIRSFLSDTVYSIIVLFYNNYLVSVLVMYRYCQVYLEI